MEEDGRTAAQPQLSVLFRLLMSPYKGRFNLLLQKRAVSLDLAEGISHHLVAAVFTDCIEIKDRGKNSFFLSGDEEPVVCLLYTSFSGLSAALFRVGTIYVVGILCAYAYNRIMVNVGQGTMRNLRIELFHHMESLPIKYFDTHAHGDIMSIYTNDVDTLRQLLSQSIPQVVNSLVSVITTFASMFLLNIPLTLLTLPVSYTHLDVYKRQTP